MSAGTTLPDDDACELAEMLEFLHDAVASAPDMAADLLARSTGSDAYTAAELCSDLLRFVVLISERV